MTRRIFNLSQILITVVLYVLSYSVVLFSQTLPYYHYTSSDGLASSSVYDLIQDRNGYIWLATANGVSKFDGHHFINYSTKDGLNSSNIINLIEGPGGEIFFGNIENSINVFKEGKIGKYSEQVQKTSVMAGMFMIENNLYSYSMNNITKHTANITNNIFQGYLKDSIILNKIVKLGDGTILAGTSKGLYRFESNEMIKMNIKGFDDQKIYWLYVSKNNEIIVGAGGMIYEINNNEVTRTIKVNLFKNNNVIRLHKDIKGNIWFTIMNRGLFLIKAGSDQISDIGKKMEMDKFLVNNFMEDNEGNMWVSTYGDGVFCFNNLYLLNYSQKDGLSNNKVLAIEKDQSDRIFIGTLDGLNVLENESINIVNTKIKSLWDHLFIYEIKSINNLVYISGTFENTGKFTLQNYKDDKLNLFLASAFHITESYKFITGSWGNQIYIQPYPPEKPYYGNATNLFKDEISTNKIYTLFNDSKNNLWIGTAEGLCKITSGNKTYFSDNEILSSTIKKIIQDKKDRVWFAGDKGIASYGLNDSAITNYSKILEYDMTSANVLAIDNSDRLWIGTMNGLFVFDYNTYSVKLLNTETGLPSQEVLSLYFDSTKNIMWDGSANGISSINISEFDNNIINPVKVEIKTVKAEDSVYLNSVNYIFEPEIKNLQIEFTAINFSSPGSVSYQYKINDEWINIPYDFVNFPFPKKGEYKLAIRGKVINNDWGIPKIVSFTVLPYFTETIVFRGSIIILLIAGIVFASQKRIKYIKKKNKENFETSNHINELKHKALSSMMNPHFIFNSLNSVQYLVNSDRKREANDYIALMAKLIRMNLDTAANSYIRLDDEIKRLDLYLRIEKLRFSGKFKYEISLGIEINPELIMIPNMIIQPFVENSIWHGLMPSGRNGLIKLSFNFENVSVDGTTFKFFVIRITDNGIGLSESQKNKKEGHISKGIEIIQERLILLSKEKNLPQPIIEDLNLKNKNTKGTEVVLSIPEELYKIISK
ncbi:MAG: two-component regulator propeller domain-containing protein [Ignavibacteria bacterium]